MGRGSEFTILESHTAGRPETNIGGTRHDRGKSSKKRKRVRAKNSHPAGREKVRGEATSFWGVSLEFSQGEGITEHGASPREKKKTSTLVTPAHQ